MSNSFSSVQCLPNDTFPKTTDNKWHVFGFIPFFYYLLFIYSLVSFKWTHSLGIRLTNMPLKYTISTKNSRLILNSLYSYPFCTQTFFFFNILSITSSQWLYHHLRMVHGRFIEKINIFSKMICALFPYLGLFVWIKFRICRFWLLFCDLRRFRCSAQQMNQLQLRCW